MGLIDNIAESLHVKRDVIANYLKSAPYRYKVFYIPKKSGKGLREIAQPARMLKELQRRVLKSHFEPMLPIHTAAMAYRAGIGIKHNAEMHASNNYLLKMDFSNFFTSIKSSDLKKHLKKHLPEHDDEHDYVAEKLFFRKLKGNSVHFLSMGAPSSPFVSNTILYEFDQKVSDLCAAHGVTYTRYADDLAFSNNQKNVLYEFPELIENIIGENMYPRLVINTQKTVFTSKKKHRRITGLVLNTEGNVSLGRDRKRNIRAMVHRYCQDGLDAKSIAKLRGLLAFAKDVDPVFYNALFSKYANTAPEGTFLT